MVVLAWWLGVVVCIGMIYVQSRKDRKQKITPRNVNLAEYWGGNELLEQQDEPYEVEIEVIETGKQKEHDDYQDHLSSRASD